jgi:hypothetical protein
LLPAVALPGAGASRRALSHGWGARALRAEAAPHRPRSANICGLKMLRHGSTLKLKLLIQQWAGFWWAEHLNSENGRRCSGDDTPAVITEG